MSRRQRTARWLLLPLAAALAGVLVLGGAGAGAVNETRGVTQANWYWRSQQVSPVDGSPVLRDPEGGDALVVSGPTLDGDAERWAVVGFDTAGLPDADRFQRAMLVLPVQGAVGAPQDTPAEEVGVDALPVVVACLAYGDWNDGGGARPVHEAPAVDCTMSAAALPGPDGAYRVEISELLPELLAGEASGVVLLPDVTQRAPYEVRIGPRTDVVLDVVYEPASVPTTTTTTTTANVPPDGDGGAPGGDGGSAFTAPTTVTTSPPATMAPRPTPRSPGSLALGPISVTRAPLAVFLLFALIGAAGLAFFSPSLT